MSFLQWQLPPSFQLRHFYRWGYYTRQTTFRSRAHAFDQFGKAGDTDPLISTIHLEGGPFASCTGKPFVIISRCSERYLRLPPWLMQKLRALLQHIQYVHIHVHANITQLHLCERRSSCDTILYWMFLIHMWFSAWQHRLRFFR